VAKAINENEAASAAAMKWRAIINQRNAKATAAAWRKGISRRQRRHQKRRRKITRHGGGASGVSVEKWRQNEIIWQYENRNRKEVACTIVKACRRKQLSDGNVSAMWRGEESSSTRN
jgi:hypothetical protein